MRKPELHTRAAAWASPRSRGSRPAPASRRTVASGSARGGRRPSSAGPSSGSRSPRYSARPRSKRLFGGNGVSGGPGPMPGARADRRRQVDEGAIRNGHDIRIAFTPDELERPAHLGRLEDPTQRRNRDVEVSCARYGVSIGPQRDLDGLVMDSSPALSASSRSNIRARGRMTDRWLPRRRSSSSKPPNSRMARGAPIASTS